MEYKEVLEKIAINMKIQRIRKKITQAELAEMIDVHEKYIGKIEGGRQNITIKTLTKIASAMDCEINEFFI